MSEPEPPEAQDPEDPIAQKLLDEHHRLVEERQKVGRKLAELRQEDRENMELIRACETILRHKGITPDPPFQADDAGRQEEPAPPRQRERSTVTKKANQVVTFLEGIYPESKHFREIHREMTRQGVISTVGKDPANSLLACFSGDPRVERTSQGTYRAKRSRTAD